MTDDIVKEMLKKISRRAKAWEKRNSGTLKGILNPYTDFGFLDNNMDPIKISELKDKYGERYNYKVGVLKNISKSDYIKVRDNIFIENLKTMADQIGLQGLKQQLDTLSQAQIMINYYEGRYDAILSNFDSEQINEIRTLEDATSKLDLINQRPLN